MMKELENRDKSESDDSWIPESFKRGMADAEAERFADMETVLSDVPPPSRRQAK